MDREWLKARRALLKSVKQEVGRRVGKLPADLVSYDRQARKLAKGRFRVSSKSEILAEAESADIVYGGDFHAHGPAQRTHLKILRQLAPERPVVLALECFDGRSQRFLDLYLAGKIDSEKLKLRSRWDERWGFPFENYRALLRLAKKRGWRVQAIGLDPDSTKGPRGLKRQDNVTAKSLRSVMLTAPHALIYVLIGELHLSHLPTLVSRQFRSAKRLREVAIHINTESVYFQLAQKGLEHSVDVIRYNPSTTDTGVTRFCIISSPPWVPWQSYLLHLDKTSELEWTEAEDREGEFDPTDHVRRMAEWIAQDLNLNLNKTSSHRSQSQKKLDKLLEGLSVYSSQDPTLWRKIESTHAGRERDFARRLMLKGSSFMLPSLGVGCLAQTTVNHAAHLASEYLQMKVSGRNRELWTFPRDFYAAILVEALSYFGSKQINHKRQAENLSDLRTSLLSIPATDEGREAMRLALDQRMSELVFFHQGRRRKSLVKPKSSVIYFEAALILGRMMGERLYAAYHARKISREEIARLFKIDVLSRGFNQQYDKIVERLARAIGTEIAPLEQSEGTRSLYQSRIRRERI